MSSSRKAPATDPLAILALVPVTKNPTTGTRMIAPTTPAVPVEYIHLTNDASKGMSGRIIPINRQLRATIIELFDAGDIDPNAHVIRTERSAHTSAQAIVNLLQRWYRDLGLVGCSSHSGRRTFITNAARKISTVGGSLRDVQHLAGHSSLQTTQRYIEGDSEARKRVVDLV
jgi:integrase